MMIGGRYFPCPVCNDAQWGCHNCNRAPEEGEEGADEEVEDGTMGRVVPIGEPKQDTEEATA